MPKTNNAIWRFFASVKLALATLILLASASIIGTLIKQGQPANYYIEEYGRGLASLFERLYLTDMYNAWWFVALLCLFAINLVVCSIERLPGVWRQMTADNLDIELKQLESMKPSHCAATSLAADAATERMQLILGKSGWKKPHQVNRNGATLIAVQKGAWTRLGVYIVHFSILVVLAGAIIGSAFGFQAYVFIPEGQKTNKIYLRKDKSPVPLNFTLQSDWFEKTYYPNGMIKQYRVDLTVIDPELSTPYRKSVIVNDPLIYKGLNFYVGDGFPMDEYYVVIRNRVSGIEQRFRVLPEIDVSWQEENVTFRIEALERDEDGAALRAKINFKAGSNLEPSVFWIEDNGVFTIRQSDSDYTFSYRKLYSTLLLVTKDPGVVTVYFGFCMMVLGLAISFFMSHRRIWIYVSPNGKAATRILVSGSSNKHKPSFTLKFEELVDAIKQDASMSPGKKKKKGR